LRQITFLWVNSQKSHESNSPQLLDNVHRIRVLLDDNVLA